MRAAWGGPPRPASVAVSSFTLGSRQPLLCVPAMTFTRKRGVRLVPAVTDGMQLRQGHPGHGCQVRTRSQKPLLPGWGAGWT